MEKVFIVGNWKMNSYSEEAIKRVEEIQNGFTATKEGLNVVVCPPFTLLSKMNDELKNSSIKVGAQDCHYNEKGAHTGDVSPQMVKDTGSEYVIIGHSERRADHSESYSLLAKKVEAALAAGLKVIFCIGETQEEKDSGKTLDVLNAQILGSLSKETNFENIIIAYEPVWAIGTSVTPTVEEIEETHNAIKEFFNKEYNLTNISVLYGGSLNAKNAESILAIPSVNGGLIGGASLKAQDFLSIINAVKL